MKPYPVSTTANEQTFSLSPMELEYIISSLQKEITKLSQIKTFASKDEAAANHKKVMELMQALVNLHSKKIWCDSVGLDKEMEKEISPLKAI